jgi:hypothetical protein
MRPQEQLDNPFDNILNDIQQNFDPTKQAAGALVACGAPASESLQNLAARLNAAPAMPAAAAGAEQPAKGSVARRPDAKVTVDELRKVKGEDPVFIHETDVAENQWAVASAKKVLENFSPDTLLGIERGGRLLTETAAAGLEGADQKLLVIPKEDDREAVKKKNLDKDPDYIIKKLMERVDKGDTKFALAESWFGGGNQVFITKTMTRFIAEANAKGKDVKVVLVFFREKIGFEHSRIKDGIDVKPVGDSMRAVQVPVRFLAGEDVGAIADTGDATNPLTVFNDRGETKTLPEADNNLPTRDQFKKLMNTQ